MATTRMRMSRKKHCKPMIDQRRMLRTEGILSLTWEPLMSTNIMARVGMLRMWMRRKMQSKSMMHRCRMWRTEGIVLERVKIIQYISDL